MRVKICGLTNLDDAQAAVDLGADMVGFVFARSPRRVSPETVRNIVVDLPNTIIKVGVFVDEPVREVCLIRDFCGLDAVQLHGNQDPAEIDVIGGLVFRVCRVGPDRPVPVHDFPSATLLLDTYVPGQAGGTSKTFDWALAEEAARQRPIILAGGLTPENVAEAVRQVRPHGVDVSSGVERRPGRKDHEKLERFIRRAKS